MDISELLAFTVKNNASDLHISPEMPPMIRIDGSIRKLDMEPLDKPGVLKMLHDIMSDNQRKVFDTEMEVDFSFGIPKLARFRVNAFQQARGPAGVFRMIPAKILTLEELKSPSCFKDISLFPRGIVLVTGPTGSGKSTTLAAMIDFINTNKGEHILTIEDPIEFYHKSKKSLVTQRELSRDTHSFSVALKSALREDPDIILVGELRDLETIRLALTAAETGHLVFATLHTSSAPKTIDRIIDVFPAAEKEMVRAMLAESLQAVIAQTLLPKNDPNGGRVAAHEIMTSNTAIRNLIRENKVPQMYSVMQTSSGKGMQTLDQCLERLVNEGTVSSKEAILRAENKSLFESK